MNRICQRCLIERDITEFPIHHKTREYIRTCKACMPQYRRGGKPGLERRREWAHRNAEKRKAHKAIEYGLLHGAIVKKPCERCGADKTQAHHDDYTRPLDVMWLCPPCHGKRHSELGRPFGRKSAA